MLQRGGELPNVESAAARIARERAEGGAHSIGDRTIGCEKLLPGEWLAMRGRVQHALRGGVRDELHAQGKMAGGIMVADGASDGGEVGYDGVDGGCGGGEGERVSIRAMFMYVCVG
ncbi:MAG: hypothetical protein SGPRY_014797 [Prymnesium sp.]